MEKIKTTGNNGYNSLLSDLPTGLAALGRLARFLILGAKS